jgi:hypothetical protein
MASIIIPCWNQLEFTRLCLDALVRHTRLRPPLRQRVFTGAGIDANRLLNDNACKFAEKWGAAVGHEMTVALKPWVELNRIQPRMNTDLHA